MAQGLSAMTTHYLALIEEEPGKAVGVIFPDLPGCFSAGDSLQEALMNAREAVELYFDGNEMARPKPRTLDDLKRDPDIAELLETYRMMVAAIPYDETAAAA
jgi:predicted RNase H-like HicB family nuclease